MTKTSSNLVVGITLLLALGAVAGHFFGDPFIGLFSKLTTHEPAPQAQVHEGTKLPGTLLVSMRPLSPEGSRAGIYRVSADSGDMTLENDDADYYAPALSHDGSWVAVVSNNDTDEGLLFVAPVTQPANAIGFAPPSPALWAGPADWSSDDKHIVYEAFTAPSRPDDTSIENTRVVLLNVNSKEQQIIDTGVSPIFATDNSVLYLKADGLYQQVVENGVATGTPERLAYFDGYIATRNSQIALSPDGGLAIVTHPDSSLFTSYGVYDSEEGAVLSAGVSVEHAAVWPVFSPDGNHIAFVELETTDAGVKSTLVAIDLTSGQVKPIKPLEGYDETYLSIRDWR